jgi:hypothetical protein
MPRIDENGNAVFHPAELPGDYRPMPHSDGNPFIREVQPMKQSRRTCKACRASFTLLGEYDPGNPAHDLCDDCLLKSPPDPNQKYSEKTLQTSMAGGGTALGEDE